MKLQEGARGRRGPKATEVLTTEQPTVQFDLLRDVPPEIWAGNPDQVAAFPLDLYTRIGRITPVGELAELRPEVSSLLKQDPQVEARIKLWAKSVWPSVLGSGYSYPNDTRLGELIPLLSVFPELRSELPEPTDDQVRSMIRQAVKPRADLGNPEFEYQGGAKYFINLLKLFPERRAEFVRVLESSEFKTKFESALAEQLSKGEFDAQKFVYLAQAAVLYPADAAGYKSLAQPFWPEIKRLIQSRSLSMLNLDIIWAAAVLSADTAEINRQGNLELTQQSKLGHTQSMPERLVA